MSEKSTCILCEGEAIWEAESREDVNFVKCETCGEYYLVEPSESVGYYREEVPREKKAMISAYTRECFERGEKPPVLGYPHGLEEIISSYENKTLDEKLENLIWYLRKKSKEFGDSVSWDARKDYPITYSLSPEGFTKIRNGAIRRGLLYWPARGAGLKLKEEGWTLGTKLREREKEEKQSK